MGKKFMSLKDQVTNTFISFFTISNKVQKIYKSLEEEKINRDQVFEIKMKEIANIDQKFIQGLESETMVFALKK